MTENTTITGEVVKQKTGKKGTVVKFKNIEASENKTLGNRKEKLMLQENLGLEKGEKIQINIKKV